MKKLKLLLVLFPILFATKGFGQSGKESARAEIADKISNTRELRTEEHQNCPCQKGFDFFVEKAYKDLNEYEPYWLEKPVGFEEIMKTIFIKGRFEKESITESDLVWTLKYKKYPGLDSN